MRDADPPLLEVTDLRVEFRSGREIVRAVNGATFSVRRGETLAVLGESGSGKSVTAAAIMRLLASPPAHITGGSIRFGGADVLNTPMSEWRKHCGRDIGMVFQDALASLTPVFSVGWQIAEPFRRHGILPGGAALERAKELLGRVGIPEPRERARDYPHQFSGGMRQRVMIAMAIALDPKLLIADEPTTALDVTVQAQIMDLLLDLQRERHMAMMLITHDLGVVAEVADHVAVMYGGRVVESGPVRDVLSRPFVRLGNADSAEQLLGALERGLAVQNAVPSEGLRDLPTHAEHRIERCQRILEHHADIESAAFTPFGHGCAEYIGAVEADAASRDVRGR